MYWSDVDENDDVNSLGAGKPKLLITAGAREIYGTPNVPETFFRCKSKMYCRNYFLIIKH